VSLPFSDHCQPLVERSSDLQELLTSLWDQESQTSKYIEIRPLLPLDAQMEQDAGLAPSESFCFHALDLRPSLDDIYRRFHKSCVQRKVQRAEKEGLRLALGRTTDLLEMFYGLMLMTRRRHQLPPQPFSWFESLAHSLGEKLVVRVALKNDQPVASILTLAHNKTVVYKYGCSDAQYHNMGGMPFLFWGAIQDAKASGAEEFDFGRSELDNAGLISFKDNWGGTRKTLTYYKKPGASWKNAARSWRAGLARRGFSVMPDFCLTAVGKLLYRHIG
jgi:lipid II:glycine glycyltransferase (peptidoglycan interpeptide bridge formation enzyme)